MHVISIFPGHIVFSLFLKEIFDLRFTFKQQKFIIHKTSFNLALKL